MKKTIFPVMLLAAALLPAGCVQTATSKDIAIPLHRENIEWCDVWYANTTKADKPAVLIVGDSISKGYGGILAPIQLTEILVF